MGQLWSWFRWVPGVIGGTTLGGMCRGPAKESKEPRGKCGAHCGVLWDPQKVGLWWCCCWISAAQWPGWPCLRACGAQEKNHKNVMSIDSCSSAGKLLISTSFKVYLDTQKSWKIVEVWDFQLKTEILTFENLNKVDYYELRIDSMDLICCIKVQQSWFKLQQQLWSWITRFEQWKKNHTVSC